MLDTGIEAFNQRPEEYGALYRSTTFEIVHAGILDLIPPPGTQVLDVGAGSGRDASAMAKRGLSVTAVEPSHGLIELARVEHAHEKIWWVEDSLPALSKLGSRHFHFILASAVWMYIQPRLREPSMMRLSRLTAPYGLVAITLRSEPADPLRGFFPVSVSETEAQAADAGFAVVRRRVDADSLGRDGVTWTTLVLRRSGI